MKKIRTQKTPPKRIFWALSSLPPGKVILGLTDTNELCRISFLRGRTPSEVAAEWQAEWTRSYFSASPSRPKDPLTLPLLMIATEFQKKVWQEVMRIPYGSVASYSEIARRIGKPRAARAVGTACGNCYLGYIVPCHRVVSASGIGGYGSDGIATKRALLKAEGIVIE